MASASENLSGRRLTPAEQAELLDLPLAGVWATVSPSGRVHAVPVHFVQSGDEMRVLTQRQSVKCRNTVQTGRATLCVPTTLGENDRRYVSVEGPVRVESPIRREDLLALDQKYGRDDADSFDEPVYRDSVIMVLSPSRVIAWSDTD